MYTEKITTTDFDGNEIKEECHFNLSKAEIVEMQLSEKGGLAERLQKLVDTREIPEIMAVFKDLILTSYGKKSPDGKFFWKKDPVDGHKYANDFVASPAYDYIFMKITQDTEYASKFVNSIIPADLRKEIATKQS